MVSTHLWLFLLISIGINAVMFVAAFRRQTDKLTDISYALSFVVLAVVGLLLGGPSATRVVIASMIAIWAGRLFTHAHPTNWPRQAL